MLAKSAPKSLILENFSVNTILTRRADVLFDVIRWFSLLLHSSSQLIANLVLKAVRDVLFMFNGTYAFFKDPSKLLVQPNLISPSMVEEFILQFSPITKLWEAFYNKSETNFLAKSDKSSPLSLT